MAKLLITLSYSKINILLWYGEFKIMRSYNFLHLLQIFYPSFSPLLPSLCLVYSFVVKHFDFLVISLWVNSIDIFFVVTMGILLSILKLKQLDLNLNQLNLIANKNSALTAFCSLFCYDITDYIFIHFVPNMYIDF